MQRNNRHDSPGGEARAESSGDRNLAANRGFGFYKMLTVVVICLICWVAYTLAKQFLKPPWSKIVIVVAGTVACIVVIRYLLILAGVHVPL